MPHYRVYKRGTYWPIRRILDTTNEIELRKELQKWSRYKNHEAGYVQVFGAVIFASVSSCLSWDAVNRSHWSGPALWACCIVLALACILTGAQQCLVLPDAETLASLTLEEVESMRLSFTGRAKPLDKPGVCTLFAWQIPMMLLSYAVICFLAGLCSVVLSPLARNPHWSGDAKVSVPCRPVSVG